TGGTAGKIESPVAEENSATGQPSNIESTVANNEIIDQLQERIRNQDEKLEQAETENQQLREQLQTVSQSLQPDYEATRDRTLNKLKVGKQSTAGKAIDAFIKELKHGL
ncbi:MAG: hypothetical protein ACYT04_70185, partial [Nostoc sp.]